MTFDKQSNSPPSTVNFKDVMEPSKLIVLPLDRLGVLKESRKKDKIVEFLCSPRSRASPDSAFGGSRSNFRPPSIDNFKSTNLLLRENGKRNGVGHSSPKG